ncbi:MAG: hypothetical protein Athens041674_745 [Parcubacteria group bacterium Athens0416_74]|nr:MAG: hypothetical protein Athens041674_745 [Parcubacteria group bacterium Athens0416_74]
MRNLLKVIGNTALVVGGFFVLLLGTSRFLNQGAQGEASANELGGGVAHADAPAVTPDVYIPVGGDGCGASDSGGGGK